MIEIELCLLLKPGLNKAKIKSSGFLSMLDSATIFVKGGRAYNGTCPFWDTQRA